MPKANNLKKKMRKKFEEGRSQSIRVGDLSKQGRLEPPQSWLWASERSDGAGAAVATGSTGALRTHRTHTAWSKLGFRVNGRRRRWSAGMRSRRL